MVLVIDTSSPCSALALAEPGRPIAEDVVAGGREHDLPSRVRVLVQPQRLGAVAICLGPGSFTGLRVGVSYGVGLAMGLGVPLYGLGSLELQAARATVPASAVVEAGRGRLHWLHPSGERGHGEPADLSPRWPVVGWLRAATAEALRAAGIGRLEDEDLRTFAEAAAGLLTGAERLSYGTVKLKYISSFGTVPEWQGKNGPDS